MIGRLPASWQHEGLIVASGRRSARTSGTSGPGARAGGEWQAEGTLLGGRETSFGPGHELGQEWLAQLCGVLGVDVRPGWRVASQGLWAAR